MYKSEQVSNVPIGPDCKKNTFTSHMGGWVFQSSPTHGNMAGTFHVGHRDENRVCFNVHCCDGGFRTAELTVDTLI